MSCDTGDNAGCDEPTTAQAAGNTVWPSSLRHTQPVAHSPCADPNLPNRQSSVLSTDSTLPPSNFSEKPRPPQSIYQLLSTSFGSTPSLTLSFASSIRSADTMNYDRTRRMSIPVYPVDAPSREKYGLKQVSKEELDALAATHPLPKLAPGKWKERLRNFRYRTMSAYMRLWALAILINFAIIIAMVCKVARNPASFSYGAAATATGANLLISALMRHEHCINLLFRVATALPHRTPLAIRRQAAKVYSYGGIHSGCGISALLWYVFYTGLVIAQFDGSYGESIALEILLAATLSCFCVITGLAHPKIRFHYHDLWEVTHRFAGWTAIALVWTQTLLLAVSAARRAQEPLGAALIKTPTFWFLIVITCCLIYPWLRLRKRAVTPEVLSSHAVRLWFSDKTLPSCVGARLSTNPLTENHGFATIPNITDLETGLAKPPKAYLTSPSSSTTSSTISTTFSPPRGKGLGYSILVSRAGDFTASLIDRPPNHIYTRGAPTRGVLHVAHLFRPIVLIGTGSGIGPCLSFLQPYPDYPVRVIWSAREPDKTYGAEVVGAVKRADPAAVVMDTKVVGRGVDLAAVAWAVAREAGAEAVVIISNPATTRRVVFELECRGMPAFGPVFDS